MRTRPWSLIALAMLALGQFGCAAGTLSPPAESMPAARAGLPPEYRIFYDALEDYGDWVLIEPLGYVFRPRDNVVGWRPYQDGFWAPSDAWGWVWISAEPFGWATYHYGQWYYDRFQGWIWIPGLDWAPAWVAWQETPDYVGWAPYSSYSYSGAVPGGAYLYVSAADLAATDLRARAMTAAEVGTGLGTPEPVQNVEERDGVTFNRGPSIERIEKLAGRLARVSIEDATPPGVSGARTVRRPGGGPAKGAGLRRPEAPAAPGTEQAGAIEAMRRAAEEAASQARAATERHGAPPATVPVLRPVGRRAEAPRESRAPAGRRRAPSPADSTRR